MSRSTNERAFRSLDERAIYQHPLAYIVGLEGLALLRAYAGSYGREFTLARLDETRALLDRADELGDGVDAHPAATREGYARWAPHYDEPGNELIDIEQPIVREILDGLPPGIALDAACGTGRHAAYLASLGHDVIGVDESPEMLAIAREKVPNAEFREGDLYDLPLPDDSVDAVVCALALTHVSDLDRVFAELVRVLRPNGHVVVSDSRGLIGDLSPPAVSGQPDGTFGYMQTWHRLASGYLDAALPLGLEVRRCAEPTRASSLLAEDGTYVYDGEPPPEHSPGRPPNIWALHQFCPEATNAAFLGNPVAIIWHFQLGPR